MRKWIAYSVFAGLVLLVGGSARAAQPPAGPAWAKNLPVYEASLDLATPHGTFNEFGQRLDELQDLGVGIVWLLPIFPRSGNPPDKPKSNSPYSVRDYYDVNPRHGTKEDFRRLVRDIHARGMFLIMDWVPNHTSWGNDLIKSHPEFYKKDKQGAIVSPGPWKDVAQLDHENRAVWQYMYEARKYWLSEFGVDGFREDVAGALPLDYWKWLRPKLDAVKPVFMLAEADAARFHPAFDMTYDWTSQPHFYMIARGDWKATAVDKFLAMETKNFPAGAVRMRHLTNHDMDYMEYAWDNREHLPPSEYPFLEKVPLAKKYAGGARAFAILTATLPNSKPMIWNGQEHGYLSHVPKSLPKDSPERQFYRRLLHAYRDNPTLYQGDFAKLANSQPNSVYAFRRSDGPNRVVVVVNLSNQPVQALVEIGDSAGSYVELFTDQRQTLAAKEALALPAWGYQVFVADTPAKRR